MIYSNIKDKLKYYYSLDCGWRKKLENFIREEYLKQYPDECLFSYIGKLFFDSSDYLEAIHWFRLDYDTGSISWWLSLRYAEALAATGDLQGALNKISDTYSKYPEAVNGYASLALRLKSTLTPQNALELVKRDISLNRLTAGFAVHHALFLAENDCWQSAIETLEQGYNTRSDLKDGFARLGWVAANKHKDWQRALELMARDEQQGRLSPGWQINLAQVYGQLKQFDHARTLIEQAYTTDSNLNDAFARLGWIKTEQQDWQGAYDLMVRDDTRNRLSPNWCINFAQVCGRTGQFDRAVTLIETAYAANPQTMDAFARLGWLKTEQQDWQSAYDLMVRDDTGNRMSPNWRINFAQVCGRTGQFDRAVALIESAYGANPQATDAFARLGLIKTKQQDWQGAYDLMVRDDTGNRMSPGWRINFAQVCGRLGQFDRAVALIDRAYHDNPQATDAFSRLGWLKAEQQDWQGAYGLMVRDDMDNRMSPGWKVKFSLTCGHLGILDRATALIEEAYNADSSFTDGFYRLGSIYLESNTKTALTLMEKDHKSGRLSNINYITLAETHGRLGHLDDAKKYADLAYAINIPLKHKAQINNAIVCFKNYIARWSNLWKRYDEENKVTINDRLYLLKKGLDAKSKSIIDLIYERNIKLIPDRKYYDIFFFEKESVFTREEIIDCEIFINNTIDEVSKSYKFLNINIDMGVFFYHHGLKLLNKKSLDYIKNKDFIDGGACAGDSALIFQAYSPAAIHSFEPINSTYNLLKTILMLNDIKNVFPVKTALGKNCEERRINVYRDTVASFFDEIEIPKDHSNLTEPIKVVRLDDYAEENNLHVGLIKLDLEGSEIEALQGAINTIKKDRPILVVAIYHTLEEFLDIKPFIEQLQLNYTFMIRKLDGESLANEVNLIAVPSELLLD